MNIYSLLYMYITILTFFFCNAYSKLPKMILLLPFEGNNEMIISLISYFCTVHLIRCCKSNGFMLLQVSPRKYLTISRID